MGIFSKKDKPGDNSGISMQEMVQAGFDPKKIGSLSKREVEAIKAKAGKPGAKGDLAAGIDDFLKGRKGSQGVGKLPPRPEGKGRSVFGGNTPKR